MDAVEDIGPHRAERLHQPAGIDEADALRHLQALHRRHRAIFAIAVGDQERADLVAGLPPLTPSPSLDDRPRAFEAGDVAGAGRHRVAAHALQAIGAVDPRRGDADQHLAGFRLGHRPRSPAPAPPARRAP